MIRGQFDPQIETPSGCIPNGGDPGLQDSLYRMQADNDETIQQQYGGPSPEMIDYISWANAVSSS